MDVQIKASIRTALSKSDKPVFAALDDIFQASFHKPCTNITELKRNNTKTKGTLFEVFCKLYLTMRGYADVWLLEEIPPNVIAHCKLKTFDVGVDLVATVKIPGRETNAVEDYFYFAIQAKYRSPTKDSQGRTVHRVNWRDLSTFIALSTTTGPPLGWKGKIVMTNADNVVWRGNKPADFKTYAKGTFNKIPREEWLKFIGSQGHSLIEEIQQQEGQTQPQRQQKEEVRSLREAWLQRLQL